MRQLLEKIDKYIEIQEKKEIISLSMDTSTDLNKIIEIIKNSSDKEKTISMFNKEIQEQIKALMEGGIL